MNARIIFVSVVFIICTTAFAFTEFGGAPKPISSGRHSTSTPAGYTTSIPNSGLAYNT